MGILQRFSDIMASNVNALLDKMEDPAKMIDQTLLNLRKDFAEVKNETANVMAAEKLALKELDKAKAEISKYTTAAYNAVRAGNDDDARTLLARKQQMEGNLPALQLAYDTAHANAVKMKQMHDKLLADVQTLEGKKAAIKAKVAAAKAQEHVNSVVAGTTNAEASLETFARMESKADQMLEAAMAKAELTGGTERENLVEKYSSGSSVSVEDELAAIKASMAATM